MTQAMSDTITIARFLYRLLAIALLAIGTHACMRPMVRSANPLPKPSLPAAPAEQHSAGDDVRAEAARPGSASEYFVFKRWGGRGPLPQELYAEAEAAIGRMPHYSLAEDRQVLPDEVRSKYDSRSAIAGGNTWVQLGPGNIGGRNRELLINPRNPAVMYLGSASGGVWKTTNGGTVWTPTSLSLPSLGVKSMAMDPRNADVLYLGTGEDGGSSGIYKTVDGGTTWKWLDGSNLFSNVEIERIVVSPTDSDRVYAATLAKGLWASNDGGMTWARVLPVSDLSLSCHDVAIRTDKASDYVFAACSQDELVGGMWIPVLAIYRNTAAESGGSWDRVFSVQFASRARMAIAPSGQDGIYAVVVDAKWDSKFFYALKGLYYSGSAGNPGTWETRASSGENHPVRPYLLSYRDRCTLGPEIYSGQGEYDLMITVDPLNRDRVWVGGIYLRRSDDGGFTWGTDIGQLHPDQHALVYHPGYNGRTNQIAYALSDGGLFFTENAAAPFGYYQASPVCSQTRNTDGVQWKSLNNSYLSNQFYHGSIFPGGASYIAGAQDQGTILGGDSAGINGWTQVGGGDGMVTRVDPLDVKTHYRSSPWLVSFERYDSGSQFRGTSIRPPDKLLGDEYAMVTPYVFDPHDSRRIYVGGGGILRSDDRGETWTVLVRHSDSAVVSALAVSPFDPDLILVGAGRGTINKGPIPGRVYRNSNSRISEQYTRDSSQQATLTIDGGHIADIVFDPSRRGVVYAIQSRFCSSTNCGHIFRSDNDGLTWYSVDGTGSGALPNLPYHSLAIDPAQPDHLYLGSDRGIFYSDDGGRSWAKDGSGLPNVIVNSLVLERNGDSASLFAFTYGLGLLKLTLAGSRPCSYQLGSSSYRIDGGGGVISLPIQTSRDCAWSARPAVFDPLIQEWNDAAGFVGIQSPAMGRGEGRILLIVPPNLLPFSRTDAIEVQGRRITVEQDGSSSISSGVDAGNPSSVLTLPYSGKVSAPNRVVTYPGKISCAGGPTRFAWWRYRATKTGVLQLGLAAIAAPATPSRVVLVGLEASGTSPGLEVACHSSLMAANTRVVTRETLRVPVREGSEYFLAAGVSEGVPLLELAIGVSDIGTSRKMTVTAESAVAVEGQPVRLQVELTGVDSQAVRWSLAPLIGYVDTSGVYHAPAAVQERTTVTINATSIAEPELTGSTKLTVQPGARISRIEPPSAIFGSGELTLSVFGENFTPSAVVHWNGSPRPTTFVSNGVLQSTVFAADLATSGVFTVHVLQPPGGSTRRLDFTVTGPRIDPNSVRSAVADQPIATHTPNLLAPGSIVQLSGAALADSYVAAGDPPLPDHLGRTQVIIDGYAAPLVSVSPDTIVFVVPWEVTASVGKSRLRVVNGNEQSEDSLVTVAEVVPAIMTLDGSGAGQGLIRLSGDLALAAPPETQEHSRPASPNDVLEIFATGLGGVSPQIRSGEAAAADANPVPTPIASAQLAVSVPCVTNQTRAPFWDERPIDSASLVPGYPWLYQIRISLSRLCSASSILATDGRVPLFIRKLDLQHSAASVASNTVNFAFQP